MVVTEKYGLELDGQDDFYDVDRTSENFRKLENAVKGEAVSSIRAITSSEYKEIVPDDHTLYIVVDGKNASMYLGSIPLSGAGGTPTGVAVPLVRGVSGTAGTITEAEGA